MTPLLDNKNESMIHPTQGDVHGFEIFEEATTGRNGQAVGRGVRLQSGRDPVAEGTHILDIYGLFELGESKTNGEISVDNFGLHHRVLAGIHVACHDSCMGKFINGIEGTGDQANVKVVQGFGSRDKADDVRRFIRDQPDKLLQVITTVIVNPGDPLRLDYGDVYWSTVDEQEETDTDADDEDVVDVDMTERSEDSSPREEVCSDDDMKVVATSVGGLP